jgi:hypothetical protein
MTPQKKQEQQQEQEQKKQQPARAGAKVRAGSKGNDSEDACQRCTQLELPGFN